MVIANSAYVLLIREAFCVLLVFFFGLSPDIG